jgi:ATP-dependent protease HslVU (ClpYQ) peptidase subunit
MTCIVGVAQGGVVYMGGDSAIVRGDAYTSTREKVFRAAGGRLLAGASGGVRCVQVAKLAIASSFSAATEIVPGNEMEFVIKNFVGVLREALERGGCLGKKDGEEYAARETSWLVGINGRLLFIDSYFSVGERDTGVDAIGSGLKYALGSLWESRGLKLRPDSRILRALEAAAHFDEHVRPPFYIYDTGGEHAE